MKGIVDPTGRRQMALPDELDAKTARMRRN